MSLLEPKPPRKRRSIATILCAVSSAGLLVSIGLCGTHLGGVIEAGSGSDRFWATIGTYLFFCSVGGFLLSLTLAVIESQRGDE